MLNNDYNASQISSQTLLKRKFYKIIKLIKDNDTVEDFYFEAIKDAETLLRKFNELLILIKNKYITVYSNYVLNAKSFMILEDKLDYIYTILNSYFN